MMINFSDFLFKLVIPIFSFIFSLSAFIFSLRKEKSKKFSIHCKILNEGTYIAESIVDRESNELPDVYHQDKYRFIPTIVITNNSSLPITITSFKLNNKFSFDYFSRIGNEYKITLKDNKQIIDNRVVSFIPQDNLEIIYECNGDAILKPVFTLQPYESTTGIIIFHYNTSQRGDCNIQIETSRGNSNIQFKISTIQESQLATTYKAPKLTEEQKAFLNKSD